MMHQADKKVYLIRHPETEANVNGQLVGRKDSPLTEKGYTQLEDIVAYLADRPIVNIFSSPSKRAKVLARALVDTQTEMPRKLVLDGRLQEIDFGRAEGLLYSDLPLHNMQIDYSAFEKPLVAGGESRADVDKRIAGFIREIRGLKTDCAVVSHGGPIRAAVSILLGLRPTDCWAFRVSNAQIITITLKKDLGILEESLVLPHACCYTEQDL